MRIAVIILAFAAIIVVVGGAWRADRDLGHTIEDYVQAFDAKQGIGNPDAVKAQIAAALRSEIQAFDLASPETQALLVRIIALAIDESTGQAMGGGFGANALRGLLRSFGPQFADALAGQLGANQEGIKEQLGAHIAESVGEAPEPTPCYVGADLEADQCLEAALAEIDDGRTSLTLWLAVAALVVLAGVLLVSTQGVGRTDRERSAYALVLAWMCLVPALSLPVLDASTHFTRVQLEFGNSVIEFERQVIGYYSESIWGVAESLFDRETVLESAVGLLVIVFSVLLPVTKTLAALARIVKPGIRANLEFLSRWTMADVVVVAIFMSYIGITITGGSELQGQQPIADIGSMSGLRSGAVFLALYVAVSTLGAHLRQRVNRRASNGQ